MFNVSPVHTIVHNDEPPSRRCVLSEGVPGVQQHGDVMIPVQEDQRLLAQHYEYRVTQLWQLGQHEHPRPEAGHFVLFYEAGIRECHVSLLGTFTLLVYLTNLSASLY